MNSADSAARVIDNGAARKPRTKKLIVADLFCGAGGIRWQENDEHDHPEPIIVELCDLCGKELIEKHPRLYRQLDRWEPWPGTMELCRTCIHRDGARCRMAKFNGGTGVRITPNILGRACGGGRGGVPARSFTEARRRHATSG